MFLEMVSSYHERSLSVKLSCDGEMSIVLSTMTGKNIMHMREGSIIIIVNFLTRRRLDNASQRARPMKPRAKYKKLSPPFPTFVSNKKTEDFNMVGTTSNFSKKEKIRGRRQTYLSLTYRYTPEGAVG